MMTFEELKKFDSSFNLVHNSPASPSQWEGPCTLERAHPAHFTFIKNQKFFQKFEKSLEKMSFSSVGVIVEESFFIKADDETRGKLNRSFAMVATVKDSMYFMATISRPFYERKIESLNSFVDGRQMGTTSIHPSALIAQHVFIGENVKIAANVRIHAGCVLMGNCEIGEGTTLFPNVSIYPNVKIGNDCRIHSHSTIGSDGFGYHFHKNEHLKIWHFGGVEIGDRVEIGASTCIDGGTFSPTLIGEGTKIDNQVQIAHNSQIGKRVILCGQAGTAGSSVVEDYCVFGARAGIGPDIKLGKGSQVAGAGLVNHDWPAGSIIAGHPARPLKEWLRGLAYVRAKSLQSEKE